MTKNHQKGFTIIEVVLVLAIAGLIFLVVFLAVPALQRSQRDTQRRGDVSRVLTAVQNYQSNNNGQVPAASALGTFTSTYLTANGDTFNDPSTGTTYSLSGSSNGSETVDEGEMLYYVSHKCSGENATQITPASNRKIAIRVDLEGAGSYCVNN